MSRFLVLLPALWAGTVLAQAPNYSYIGGEYILSESSKRNSNADGDGFGLDFNYSITDLFYVLGGYSTRSLEEGSVTDDLDLGSLGAGVRIPLAQDGRLSVFGGVSFEYFDVSRTASAVAAPPAEEPQEDDGLTGIGPLDDFFGGGGSEEPPAEPTAGASASASVDGTGFGLQTGVRYMVMDALEVNGSYRYRSYSTDGNYEDEGIISLGAGYQFGEFAVVLSYDIYDESELDEIRIGGRYLFGSGM